MILKVYSSLCRWENSARGGERGQRARLTVDGDGHALVENVTVFALEGRDLAQLVELQVLGGGFGGVDLDDVELEVVGLRNGANGRAPGVVLPECVSFESKPGLWRDVRRSLTSYVYSLPKAIVANLSSSQVRVGG